MERPVNSSTKTALANIVWRHQRAWRHVTPGKLARLSPCEDRHRLRPPLVQKDHTMKQRIELPDHLFTVEETAKLINASSKTIYRRIRTGELPAYRDGRILRIHPNDLARYIAAHRSR